MAAIVFNVSSCAPARQIEGEAKPKVDPPGAPLEAKLIANSNTYTLDMGGKTPEQFREIVEATPPVIDVDLVLELRNTSEKTITIWIADDYRKEVAQEGGDYVTLELDLEGPGASNALVKQQITKPKTPPPRSRSIAPGKSFALPITTLNYGTHGVATYRGYRFYWSQPGAYTLTASFKTAVSPAPLGSKEAIWSHFEGGLVTVTSAPVVLHVVEKGKE
jgi:hypothetical protein